MDETKRDYVTEAMSDGFSVSDLVWQKEHGEIDPETFFTTVHDMIASGKKTVKQIKLEHNFPLVYDEAKDGSLIRANSGMITEEVDTPVALQMIKGNPAKTIDNFLEIFHHDPKYDGIRFNLLKNQPERYRYDLTDNTMGWHGWKDSDDSWSVYLCEHCYNLSSDQKHNHAMRLLWEERQCNPVVDMLNALPAWDGIPRCTQFLQAWLKADDSEYTRTVGQLIFDGAVSRAYSAGCKFDLCLVLVGENQGEGKSTIIQWLALEDEYYGNLSKLSNRDMKDVVEDILGKWVIEIGEFVMGDSIREQNFTKDFITRTQDTYRTPYDRHTVTLKRRCVFIASTNHREFLTDSTGGRRWLPVITHSKGSDLFANEKEVKDYIKKCYAEAVYRFHNGLCVLDIPDEVKEEVKRMQELATVEDDRVGVIEEYCRSVSTRENPFVCGREVWREALHYPPEKYTRKASLEINEILRKIDFLKEEGKKVKTFADGDQRGYRIMLKDEE